MNQTFDGEPSYGADGPEPVDPGLAANQLRARLVSAATQFDRRAQTRRGWNPYALPQYLARIDEVIADVRAGADPRAAIIAGFCDRLRDALLKACGFATEARYAETSVVYRPVNA